MHKDNYKPILSIIIPVHNEAEKTVRCFASIRANTSTPYEIIWVDNGTSNIYFPMIKKAATKPGMHTKLVKFNTNIGFVKGTNAGIKEIEDTSKFVIFLNNDTEVTKNWEKGLIEELEDQEVGAVGPITQSKISWQEAENMNRLFKLKLPKFGTKFLKKPDSRVLERYASQVQKNKGLSINCGTIPLSFFCAAFRTDVINRVGPLDEAFGYGLGDDDEYCHRLRSFGYRLSVRLDSFVYHHHRTTFKSLKLPVDNIRRRNVKILRDKKKENEIKAEERVNCNSISSRLPCIP